MNETSNLPPRIWPRCYSLRGDSLFKKNNRLFLFLDHGAATWDLSSLTGDRTLAPALEAWSLNPWTAWEVQGLPPQSWLQRWPPDRAAASLTALSRAPGPPPQTCSFLHRSYWLGFLTISIARPSLPRPPAAHSQCDLSWRTGHLLAGVPTSTPDRLASLFHRQALQQSFLSARHTWSHSQPTNP